MKKLLLSMVCLAMSAIGSVAAAPAENLTAPETPDAIKAPATDAVSFALNAKGVQIYECRAKELRAPYSAVYLFYTRKP